MNYTTCKAVHCGAKIGYLRIPKTGAAMPVDPTPVVEWLAIDKASGFGPRVTLVKELPGHEGEVVTGQRPEPPIPVEASTEEMRRRIERDGLVQVVGYVAHFATCPASNMFRTAVRRAAPTEAR